MKHLGLTPQSALEWAGGKPVEIFIGDREFSIARDTRWYDTVAAASIRAIEARVVGSRRLDLRITLSDATANVLPGAHLRGQLRGGVGGIVTGSYRA